MLEKDSRTETHSLSTGVDNDEGLLASLGYKQGTSQFLRLFVLVLILFSNPELKRQFKPLEIFGIAFSIIGIAPALSYVLFTDPSNGYLSRGPCRSVLIYSLPNGGAFAMVWGVRNIFLQGVSE